MNIAYSTDNNYVRHVYVSMNSLMDKNNDISEINFYIICDEVDMNSKNILKSLVLKYSNDNKIREIHFIDFEPMKKRLANAIPWAGSLAAYGRIFLPEQKIDKVLYLDCDTVVASNILELYNINILAYGAAGVQDNAGPNYRTAIGLNKSQRYINSGMLLMNLEHLRKIDFINKSISYIEKKNGQVVCCDQGIVNHILQDEILIVAPKNNVMTPMFNFKADEISKFFEVENYYSNEEIENAKKNPIVVHYTGGFYVRPWYKNGNHPKNSLYVQYMKGSPWENKFYNKINLGKRTEWMKLTYKILPFPIYLITHRIVRKFKKIIKGL